MAYRTNEQGEIEEIDLPMVHTELLMLRGTPEGDWYFPSTTGLHHGPFRTKEIALIEFYRLRHAELTGECYINPNRSIDIEKGLKELERTEATFFGTNFTGDVIDVDTTSFEPELDADDIKVMDNDIDFALGGVTPDMGLKNEES
jgi:hypothetical protein